MRVRCPFISRILHWHRGGSNAVDATYKRLGFGLERIRFPGFRVRLLGGDLTGATGLGQRDWGTEQRFLAVNGYARAPGFAMSSLRG